MTPYLGYPIVLSLLGVLVFFSGRAVLRDIRGQLSGNGCGGCCSSCGSGCSHSAGTECSACSVSAEEIMSLIEKNKQTQ